MSARYDLHFEGVSAEQTRENFLFLTFGETGATRVRGLRMLVDHWAKCFLTPRGSDPSDRRYGTEFSRLIGSNLSLEDARDITLIAMDTCTQQVKNWQMRDDTLTPAERVAFVLHDVFAVPFDDIASIVGRSPDATRQLASRGRRRIQGAPVPDTDLDGQWVVVEAFLAASRDGDFERLLAVLDPDVVLRSDGGDARPRLDQLVHGNDAVASNAMLFRNLAATASRTLVNGVPGGVVWSPDGSPFAVLAFTVAGGRIVSIDVLADPDRLARLDLERVAD